MTHLDRLRDETLIDRLGEAQCEVAAAQKKLKEVKDAIERRGLTKGDGTKYSFTVTTTHSDRLDSKAVRSMLAPALLAKCMKRVVARQWHIHALVTRKEAVGAKAA